MREMSAKGLGASAVVEPDGRVLGIFTDGDLRRLIETGVDLRAVKAARRDAPRPAHHPRRRAGGRRRPS